MKLKESVDKVIGAAARLRTYLNRRRPQFSRKPFLKTLPFWSAAVLVGVFSAGYAVIFDYVAEFSSGFLVDHPIWTLVLSPLCFLFAWWVVHRVAPNAGGSGIPQVMAASELIRKEDLSTIDRLLGLKTALIKVISSLICVMGGGAVGREGPTIQIASSIFYFIGRKSKNLLSEISLRPFIIAGGAAGVASAFNTPLGGIVFAVEELAKSHFHIFKGALIFAVVVSGVIAQLLLGPYLYLGYPSVEMASMSSLPVAIVVSLIAGAGGAFFGKLLSFLIMEKNKRLKSAARLAGFALLCGLSIAVLSYFLGISSVGPGKKLINGLLFHGEPASWESVFGRFFSPLISYVSGCAGGVFAPSLAAGAVIGQKIAVVLGDTNTNLMVLMGMIAFLTGVTGSPFTSFVLVLEMTDRHSAIFFMMLAALIAFGVSRLVGTKTFYETMQEGFVSKNTELLKPSP